MTIAAQLDDVRAELRDASSRLAQLASSASDEQWATRPPSGGWSAAECVAHLTLTTEGYLPLLNAARTSVPAGAALPHKYAMGLGGRLLWWLLKPPAHSYSRSRTIAAFVPKAAAPKAETVAAFEKSQTGLLGWIASVEQVPLDQIVITSPFNEKLHYNAYAALRVLAVHQQRHLWQAERALRGIP